MKFIKDILLIELETTGTDPDKDSIIQFSALLLDKDNLLEKDFFNSLVRVSMLENTISKHAAILGIGFDEMRKSPKIYDTLKKFTSQFDRPVLLASHNLTNIFFLRNAYRKSLIPFEFDSHILELWTLNYIYTLSCGIKKLPTLHTLMDHFGMKLKNPRNAFEKIRAEAEIFRKVIKGV
jgi:DNA polymerase III alpha subunit (gram-positive type)